LFLYNIRDCKKTKVDVLKKKIKQILLKWNLLMKWVHLAKCKIWELGVNLVYLDSSPRAFKTKKIKFCNDPLAQNLSRFTASCLVLSNGDIVAGNARNSRWFSNQKRRQVSVNNCTKMRSSRVILVSVHIMVCAFNFSQ